MAVLTSKPTVKVHEPGDEVTLWGNIKARIDAVMIEPGHRVSYRMKWWNGGALCTEWVGHELIVDGKEYAIVGFAERK